MKFESICEEIAVILKEKITKSWDGKNAIIEMKNSGYNQWRQMEWIGFYFQYYENTWSTIW